jgi:hypothetical protein
VASAMDDMSFFLYNFCPIEWNYNIVGSGSNDEIIRYSSQAMPGSKTFTLLFESHTEEASQATTILGALNTMTSR